jgi:hypothetical protein
MSTTEILAELPTLPPDELEAIWQAAGHLLEGRILSASPELLAAVDEADGSWEREGGVPTEEAHLRLDSWLGK